MSKDLTAIFEVVINHEEQYSIWPIHKDVPQGWTKVGYSGEREKCLNYIKEVWVDMRPKSLRDML
ncbi:MbtH family NRPS accessory protein [Paenibacillus sp. MER 180]|uniref:MbtH family protein n=1 Tax=unclassified Paenibacillus TaxID=185978 RepID=UPI00080656CD|nr:MULTISPECIES: MbtH family NRPS accessory protein [unclassified Paenibacillus]MCM3291604.1 MbtH family NRPS accessory protein [Paenibacillus sp. MER 180]OBY78848.1 antibiotic synthesis protein MbtH [Paenibacillus sp. KS1]